MIKRLKATRRWAISLVKFIATALIISMARRMFLLLSGTVPVNTSIVHRVCSDCLSQTGPVALYELCT